MPNSTFVTGNHLGSLWFIEANNQNNHPYLLDWYYTSRPHDATSRDVPTDLFEETPLNSRDWMHNTSQPHDGTSRDVSTDLFEETPHHSRDWMPSSLTQNEPYEEYMNGYHDDRVNSHLGASVSAPIFRESIIRNQDSDDLHRQTRSHWWARSHHHQEGGHDKASFYEPPDFNHERAFNNTDDKLSEIGSENQDQEQQLHWPSSVYHKSFHSAHTHDLESGEINLHFDDFYRRPPENSTVNPFE